jgi:nitrite reductase (NADH) large subunit
MSRPKLVVVGNGMAGVRTLEELFKRAPDRYAITVFGSEPHPNYNRILLSPVLAGERTLEDIVLNDFAWYQDHAIELRTGCRVDAIDRSRRIIRDATGATTHYDRLLLATGSLPIMLPIPGRELEGVLAYRDIADTQAMLEASSRYRHAVVIGGGLLGLEAACGLTLRGMQVTVVHLAGWLMERQLDETAATLLRQSLEERGLAFRLGAKTTALEPAQSGRIGAVRLASGEAIAADLVVMAIGIRPNTALAEAAGLPCRQGVLVDDTLQTYDPRIYAVGECANHRGQAYGLVAPLFEQARVCADHLAGLGTLHYSGSVLATKLKVTGIDVFSAGNFQADPGTDELLFSDDETEIYRKLVVRQDKLIGACLYGDTDLGPWYQELIRLGVDISALRDVMMFDDPGQTSPAVPAPQRAAHAPAAT